MPWINKANQVPLGESGGPWPGEVKGIREQGGSKQILVDASVADRIGAEVIEWDESETRNTAGTKAPDA